MQIKLTSFLALFLALPALNQSKMAEAPAEAVKPVQIKLRTLTSRDEYILNLKELDTISQIREEVTKVLNIPADRQQLIQKGKIIHNDSPLTALQISQNGVLVVRPISEEAVAAKAAQKQEQSAQDAANTANAGNSTAPPNVSAGGMDMINQLMGMASGHGNLVEMMGNPEILRALQEMVGNPEQFQSMITQNPMLQQLARNNPQVQAMIQDPQALMQLFQPEVMSQIQSFMQSLTRGQNQGEGTAEKSN